MNGTWEIYSKNVVIDPAAIITGTGTIHFYNPSVAGGASSPTLIDGNDGTQAIGVAVVHQNASGLQLINKDFPTDLVAAGFTNNSTSATLYLGADIDLAVDGADITLGSSVKGDLKLNADAGILNYRPERMVITNNSTLSHLVKQNPDANFVFPVGIADGDYTPAKVISGSTISVSVQDATTSAANTNLLDGSPNRVWEIYSDVESNATVILQHNLASESSPFDSETDHHITQYKGNTWSVTTKEPAITADLTTGSSLAATASIQSLTGVTIPTSGSGTYFSKTGAAPLPVKLARFELKKLENTVSLIWQTSEQQDAAYFDIERSQDGINWMQIGTELVQEGSERKLTNYQHEDVSPLLGVSYYRLKMVDLDGSSAYSTIRNIRFDHANESVVYTYPNPAHDVLKISKINPQDVSSISIFNQNGLLMQAQNTYSVEGIDIRSLPSGIYILRIQEANQKVSNHKIVIHRK
jgi:hypothetical protein